MLPLELASGGRGDKLPRALVGLKSPGWSGCGSGTRDDVAIGRTPLQAAMVLLKRCQMHTLRCEAFSFQTEAIYQGTNTLPREGRQSRLYGAQRAFDNKKVL